MGKVREGQESEEKDACWGQHGTGHQHGFGPSPQGPGQGSMVPSGSQA